jgi:hypothetical protein
MQFFLICILNTCFLQKKISLGNFVTDGDAFISKFTLNVKF